MRSNRRKSLQPSHYLASAVLVAAIHAGTCQAQTPPPPGSNDDTSSADIIVTAQKKSERQQDVPMSISTVTRQQLTAANATSLLDIIQLVPGIQILSQTGAPGGSSLSIRGITTGDTQSNTVATLVDDVPIGSSSANAFAATSGLDLLPYDVERIEVLKGPQGTLYGATSLGGLLKYVTPTPNLSDLSVKVGGDVFGVSHGSQVGYSARADVNLPLISDVLAADISYGHNYQPGFINNVALGQKDFNHGVEDSVRASLYFKPNDRFDLKATAIYQRSNFDGISAVPVNTATVPTLGYYDVNYLAPFGTLQHTQLYILNGNYDLGWAKLTSITSYSKLDTTIAVQLIGSLYTRLKLAPPDNYTTTTKKVTQEFRLAGKLASPLSYQVGVFYTHEKSSYYESATAISSVTGQVVAAYTPFYTQGTPSTYEEIAGFANLTWQITPKWDVSVGGRESHNHQTVYSYGDGFLNGGPLDQTHYDASDSSFTYSADTRYHFTRDVMVYGRIAKGYRPGGPNTAAGAPATYAPDTTINYEGGLKSQLFDDRLLLNLTGYYIDWTNIHIRELTDAGQPYTGNAGKASSKGVEFETSLKLTPDLRVGFNGVYADAKLDTAYAALGAPDGFRLPNTPRFSSTVTGDWTHRLSNTLSARLSANWIHVGNKISNFPLGKPPGQILPAYDDVNLSAGVFNDKWDIHVFVKNLGNKQAYLALRNYGATVLTPRTIGLSVDRSF